MGAVAAGPVAKVGVKSEVKGNGPECPFCTNKVAGQVGRRMVPSLFRRSFLLSPLADGVLAVRYPPSWFLPPLRWNFIAFDRSVSLPSAFENPQGFRAI